MPTDTERREVARRLREIRPCKSGHIKWWEIARALGLKQPAGWFGWEKFENDSANRLADLIEPSGKGIESDAFDRDALLELAEDVDEAAAMAVVMDASKGAKLLADLLLDIARRIREALGES